jgi:hypothetical protein
MCIAIALILGGTVTGVVYFCANKGSPEPPGPISTSITIRGSSSLSGVYGRSGTSDYKSVDNNNNTLDDVI